MSSADVAVPLGVVVRAHGLRGEVRVSPYNAASTLLGERREVVLRRDGVDRVARVRSVRRATDAWLFVFEGVQDRDAAEALRGTELCVRRSEFPGLGEGEWYLVDLVGLRVETPNGAAAGEVLHVVEYPAAACIAVRGADGVREVPLRAPYLVRVELAAGRVIVDGLDELEVQREVARR